MQKSMLGRGLARSFCMLIMAGLGQTAKASDAGREKMAWFAADDPAIQYMGRIDRSDPRNPRFWAAGVSIRVKFKGTTCLVVLADEKLYGDSYNYIEIQTDDGKPYRLRTKRLQDTISVSGDPGKQEHILTICKNTESGMGYLVFKGLCCEQLLPLAPLPSRKIEFIGNSITCGAGMDLSDIPCDKGKWYDQHNAWLSYGPLTARALDAQWQLTSVSGIGLIHSCCNMTITMPQVFDKVNQRVDSIVCDFRRYQPDVVTICLGQNDGVQDSTAFCSAYLRFIGQLRHVYPDAQLICLTSPMGNPTLTAALKSYLTAVCIAARAAGDPKVHSYFYVRQYAHGCGGHPDMAEHEQIAAELTAYIRQVMGW